jgi:hypothetical protein
LVTGVPDPDPEEMAQLPSNDLTWVANLNFDTFCPTLPCDKILDKVTKGKWLLSFSLT